MLTFIVVSCLINTPNTYATISIVRSGKLYPPASAIDRRCSYGNSNCGSITVLLCSYIGIELHPQRGMDDAPLVGTTGTGPSDMSQGSGSIQAFT